MKEIINKSRNCYNADASSFSAPGVTPQEEFSHIMKANFGQDVTFCLLLAAFTVNDVISFRFYLLIPDVCFCKFTFITVGNCTPYVVKWATIG